MRQLTLAYTVRHREDRDTADVIASMFYIYSIPYFALINIVLTHSFIASIVSVHLVLPVWSTFGEIFVLSPLG